MNTLQTESQSIFLRRVCRWLSTYCAHVGGGEEVLASGRARKRTEGMWRLRAGAEKGVEHFQVLVTNLLQKRWEWQEKGRETVMHRVRKYKTMYLASLDVKTAFGVAKPGVTVLPEILANGECFAATT